MNKTKQTLKTTLALSLTLFVGLFFSLGFLQINTATVQAASKKAKNSCNSAVENTTNNKAKQTLKNNIDACYYGYDEVGDVQDYVKKCRNKYPENENKQGACMAGVGLAQSASSEAPPPIGRCNGDDIKDSKGCKKAYKKCDKKKGKKQQNQCKEDVINSHKNKEAKDPVGLGDAGDYICGTYDDEEKNVHTKFDFGCLGTEYAASGQGQKNISPIVDMAYAAIRFLSIGVGIVIAISVIMSGIQYSMSEGNAEVTQKAKSRIRSAILGLIIYVFTFSILQFLIPGGIFQPGIWLDESVLQLISRLNPWIF
jgi:hypothetical protein